MRTQTAHTHGETPNTTVGIGEWSPLEVAIALSLYAERLPYQERSKALFAALDEITLTDVERAAAPKATRFHELPLRLFSIYVQHALERYGEEARERVRASL